jgi:hypothetical protein
MSPIATTGGTALAVSHFNTTKDLGTADEAFRNYGHGEPARMFGDGVGLLTAVTGITAHAANCVAISCPE